MFDPMLAMKQYIILNRIDIHLRMDIDHAIIFESYLWTDGNICYHPSDEGLFEIWLENNGFTMRYNTLFEAVKAMDLITKIRSYDSLSSS